MSLRPFHREKKILETLQQHGSIPTKELAEMLGVSLMTLHRDLNKLAAQGLLYKARGEVMLPKKVGSSTDACAMCGKTIPERVAFVVIFSNGEHQKACCAHCGLMLQDQSQEVLQSMTVDFLYGHVLSASYAFYVVQSEVTVCCMPSVLAFGKKQDAEKFVMGFGGSIFNMKEAISELKNMILYR